VECPGKEEDLSWRALFFGGADDGGYCFEIILMGCLMAIGL
jgi:hypothetical protein